MAAAKSTLCLALVIVGTLMMPGDNRVSAQCGTQVPDLISKCFQFVQIPGPQVPPSADCCAVIKTVDIPCVCNLVTPEIEKLISMPKVVFVGRTCGLTINPGLKCGSYVVPPLAR